MHELFHQFSYAQEMIDRIGGGEMLRAIQSMRSREDAITRYVRELEEAAVGFSSVQDCMKRLTASSIIADWVRQQQVERYAPLRMLESIDYDALEVVRRWQSQMEENPASSYVGKLQQDIMRAADPFHGLGVGGYYARELEATQRMLSRPEWAYLTEATAKALGSSMGSQFEPDSIYSELVRRMADRANAIHADGSEHEVLDVVKDHFRKHNKKHDISDLLAILFWVFTETCG